MLSGIGINDELVPHLKWLLAKNDLEALFPSFPIVDTLTLPLIEIGDEKQADLTRTPLFIKQESPKMLFGNSPRFDLSLLQRFVSLHVDMRVIAASNVPLKEMVTEGKMRSDFYYRINVIPVHLVPLRQRKVDIPLLVHDFLRHHPIASAKGINAISKKVMNVLMEYTWPGNIRELQNVLEPIVSATGHIIEVVDLHDLAYDRQPNEGRAALWMNG